MSCSDNSEKYVGTWFKGDYKNHDYDGYCVIKITKKEGNSFEVQIKNKYVGHIYSGLYELQKNGNLKLAGIGGIIFYPDFLTPNKKIPILKSSVVGGDITVWEKGWLNSNGTLMDDGSEYLEGY